MIIVEDQNSRDLSMSKTAPSEVGSSDAAAQPPPYSRPPTADIPIAYVRADAANLNGPGSPPFGEPSSSSLPLASPPPPPIQPCNNLAISRTHDSIKGSFVLDPSLRIPPALLPPLTPEEESEGIGEFARRNLRFEVKHGYLDADVWVIDGKKRWREQGGGDHADAFGVGDVKRDLSAAEGTKLVQMAVKVTHGDAKLRIRSEDGQRIRLTFSSTHSNVKLCLPKSFSGPVTITNKRSVLTPSSTLSSLLTTFSDVNGLQQGFIGDYSHLSRSSSNSGWREQWSGKLEDWDGDILVIEATHSRVKLHFVDEMKADCGNNNGPLGLAKFFSWM